MKESTAELIAKAITALVTKNEALGKRIRALEERSHRDAERISSLGSAVLFLTESHEDHVRAVDPSTDSERLAPHTKLVLRRASDARDHVYRRVLMDKDKGEDE